MEMHQVRYFLAVARTLNFTKAADECHVAQPSLSRAIKKLEEELGGDLFRRERTLTHLTELGRLMFPLLAQCYESAIGAKALASTYKKGAALPLRLALSHTVNLGLLAAPLTELVRAFPALQLKFIRGTGEEVAESLKSGESETAIAGPFADIWERFERWALFTESFSLAVNKVHPLANRNMVEFRHIEGERLLHRSYCEMAAALTEILMSHDIGEGAGDKVASDHDLISLLEANVGVAILPESAPVSEKLCRVAIDGLNLERTVSIYSVSGRERSPAANALIKLLRAADWGSRCAPRHAMQMRTPLAPQAAIQRD
jgi:DNA-binding transcriptional LysR family regulator